MYFNIKAEKAEFSAAITPVFSVTWSFRKQVPFLIINVENSFCGNSLLFSE